MTIKKLLYFALAAVMTSCSGAANSAHADGDEHEHEHGHGGGDEIVLEPAEAQNFGVTVEQIEPSTFSNVIKCSGAVQRSSTDEAVVVAPVSGTVNFGASVNPGSEVSRGNAVASVNAQAVSGGDSNRAAKAAVDAARREMERLEPLAAEHLVSAADYAAAKAAYEQAKAAYVPAASSGTATSPITGVVTELLVAQGGYVNAGEPIARVSADKSLTLRADVPAERYRDLTSINDARIVLPYGQGAVTVSELKGHRQGGATVGSTAYVPVYFTFANNGTLLPGTSVDVYLLGTERAGVLSVPVSALSEQQGNYYVYEQIDEEGYAKRLVSLGASDGARVEILSGISAGANIVVTGTTTVRLAESSGNIPEGHSHNH
jgi:RND family efflux transporter MFP subunit